MKEIAAQGKEAISTQTHESDYLGVKEVAIALKASEVTVLRWVRAGKLDGFFRIGRKWLVRRSSLDSFINQKVEAIHHE